MVYPYFGSDYHPALAIGGVDQDVKGICPMDEVVDLQVREQIWGSEKIPLGEELSDPRSAQCDPLIPSQSSDIYFQLKFRLILPDPTAIGWRLSHASYASSSHAEDAAYGSVTRS